MPLSASDATSSKVLGTITAVGSVQVRGYALHREGTLFSGDQVRTDEKGYAKVSLPNVGRVEVSGGSELVVTQESGAVHIGLTSGHVGFTSPGSSLTFSLGRYEVLPKAGSAGGIGYLTSEEAAINILSGSVTLREPATKQTLIIPSGGEYTIKLKADGPIAQVVSLIPPTMPAVLPPAPQTPSSSGGSGGISKKAIALWSVVGGAAITGTVLAVTKGNGTNEVPANCSTQQAQAVALGNSLMTTAQQTQAAIAPVLSSNAIANTQNGVLTSIIGQLNTNLQSVQNTGSCATVSTDLTNFETIQAQLNGVLSTLQNSNLPNTVQLPGKNHASPSLP